MIECYNCGSEFTVKFVEEEFDINFCPHCGKDFNSIDDGFIENLYNEDEVDNY